MASVYDLVERAHIELGNALVLLRESESAFDRALRIELQRLHEDLGGSLEAMQTSLPPVPAA